MQARRFAPTPRRGSHVGRTTRRGHRQLPVDGPLDTTAVLSLQRLAGNRAVTQLIVQRRAGQLPVRATLDAGPKKLLEFDDRYDKVLDAVDAYHALPATAYDKQIHALVDTVPSKVNHWVAANGSLSLPASTGLFDVFGNGRRRGVLKTLDAMLPAEDAAVRQQGFTAATAKHAEDRTKLNEYLTNGLASSERRLKNSCAWIKTAGKTKLYALTPTGDSYARLKKGGKDPDKDEAWFPRGYAGSAGDLNSPAVSYVKDDLTDNTNVVLDDQGKITGGWNLPGLIAVTKPASRTQATVWETFRHEVQHDADKARGRDAQAGVRAAAALGDAASTATDKANAEAKLDAEKSLQRYKTEYRAYSYQGSTTYDALDNAAQNVTHDGKQFSARQLAIFKHIYKGYAYTKKHWDADSELTGGTKFKDAVVSYWNADTEGVNKYNSPAVDDFWQKLDVIGAKKAAGTTEATMTDRDIRAVDTKVSDKTDVGVVALLTAITALSKDDAKYIRKESPAMQAKIAQHLDGEAKAAVEAALKQQSK